MRVIQLFLVCCCAASSFASHIVEISGPVPVDEEGLVLGNGDLSCSVFQNGDETVFRFGKGDVWDRRIAWSLGEGEPPTYAEFVRGLLDEGWTCRSYDRDGSVAKKGTRNERRFREICRGDSPVLSRSLYPCPKPTGELRMRVAPDLPRPMNLTQRLIIEEGRLELKMAWPNGVTLTADAVIAPMENVFSVKWRMDGWDTKNSPQKERPPVTFAVRRRADEDPMAIMTRLTAESGSDYMERKYRESGLTALPPPETVVGRDGRVAVEQRFPAEKTFPEGFRCRLTLSPSEGPRHCFAKCVKTADGQVLEAYACYRPKTPLTSGEMQVMVTTSRDASLEAPAARPHSEVVRDARQAAEAAFALSGVRFPEDPELEKLWYATYHVRRCVLRSGTVQPGLFMPSTVNDYSPWHGDYHSNYNYQSIYWGALGANRLDEQVAAMDCTDVFLRIGRLRAQKYYGMRGAFVPLEGFPLETDRDYSTALTMGRMVYMTGWAAVPYWEHYLHTLDRTFLQRRGYPAIRDCALFYLDFLKKAPSKDLPPELKDGLYHAFPSIEEETPIRSLADVTDRPQVMAFVRYALQAAIAASKELDVDADLREQWQDRLDHLAGVRCGLKGYARHCYLVNSPEFGYDTPTPCPPAKFTGGARNMSTGWYFGHSIRSRVTALRNNEFVPERDFGEYRSALAYWAHPNGLVWGMSIGLYGRAGAWTETLSCLAPLQEMILQSWDGAIRLFPYWPRDRDAAFKTFRAQGAFLVSSEWKGGRIGKTMVFSEKGADCHVHGTWRVRDSAGVEVATTQDEFGRQCFKTCAGKTYELTSP